MNLGPRLDTEQFWCKIIALQHIRSGFAHVAATHADILVCSDHNKKLNRGEQT